MSQQLLYRLFRIGRLPRAELDRLADEGVRCIVEGIALTIGWRRFRQPGGRYISRHVQSVTGNLALTEKRLRIYASSRPLLDLDLADPVAESIAVSCPKPNTLAICLEARDFHPGSSGQITYWLVTNQAATLADLWHQRRPAAADGLPRDETDVRKPWQSMPS